MERSGHAAESVALGLQLGGFLGGLLQHARDDAAQVGLVERFFQEVDRAFLKAVVAQSCPGPRDIRIVYSPLHGVGTSAVLPDM